MENVENTISEPLDLKIFWGRMPQDPPPPPLQTRVSGARFRAVGLLNPYPIPDHVQLHFATLF